MHENQYAFMGGRQTSDHTFTLRTEIKKSTEYDRGLYMAFLSLQPLLENVKYYIVDIKMLNMNVTFTLDKCGKYWKRKKYQLTCKVIKNKYESKERKQINGRRQNGNKCLKYGVRYKGEKLKCVSTIVWELFHKKW